MKNIIMSIFKYVNDELRSRYATFVTMSIFIKNVKNNIFKNVYFVFLITNLPQADNSKTNRARFFILAYDTLYDKMSPLVKFRNAILYNSRVSEQISLTDYRRTHMAIIGHTPKVDLLCRSTFFGLCNYEFPRACQNAHAFFF